MDEQNNVTQTAETTTTGEATQETAKESSANVDIERLIQKAVDRATNKLGNDNKKLREELAALKKEKMTDDEVKQLELREKEADIADRESKLKDKENRLLAIKAIKEAGLDDGGNNSLELVEFVMGDDETVMKAKVKTFQGLVKKFVAAEVNRTFKEKGRNPDKGGQGTTDTKTSIAAKIGKTASDRNAAANKVLNHYLGGSK